MHILSLVREVDVVEQEREVLEHPLGQVEVDRGAFEEEWWCWHNIFLSKSLKPWRKHTWKTVSPTQPRFSICTRMCLRLKSAQALVNHWHPSRKEIIKISNINHWHPSSAACTGVGGSLASGLQSVARVVLTHHICNKSKYVDVFIFVIPLQPWFSDKSRIVSTCTSWDPQFRVWRGTALTDLVWCSTFVSYLFHICIFKNCFDWPGVVFHIFSIFVFSKIALTDLGLSCGCRQYGRSGSTLKGLFYSIQSIQINQMLFGGRFCRDL